MKNKIEQIRKEIEEEALERAKRIEENYLIKLSDIPKNGVEIRVIDIAKFNQYFGVPWENIKDDMEWIKNTPGFWLYFSWWAWRGWCFVKKLRPDEEITFSEWGSMFRVAEALDMFNLFFPLKTTSVEAQELRKSKDKLVGDKPIPNEKVKKYDKP